MLVWTLRIVGILTMLVCLVSVVSYPGTAPEFELAAGIGGGLLLPALTCTMGLPMWILLELVLLACTWGAIRYAPPDLPGVALMHLGLYPGVLLGIMVLLLLIFIGQVWPWRQVRKNSVFDYLR